MHHGIPWAYDVSDSKRLRRIFRRMNGFGNALQHSVFACDLSSRQQVLMEEALTEIIDLKDDRVIIINIGPAGGRGESGMHTLGRQTRSKQREALVI